MNVTVQIPVAELNELLIQKMDEVFGFLHADLQRQVFFVNKAKAVTMIGTAVFLRAGEMDGLLTPIHLGGSAGTLYSVEQLQELSRWICKKAQSGSLPDHYIISNKKTADEKEVHSHHYSSGRQKNLPGNKRNVSGTTGEPSPGGSGS